MLFSIADGFDRFVRWFVNASPETTRIEPLATLPRSARRGSPDVVGPPSEGRTAATAGSSKRGVS